MLGFAFLNQSQFKSAHSIRILILHELPEKPSFLPSFLSVETCLGCLAGIGDRFRRSPFRPGNLVDPNAGLTCVLAGASLALQGS